MSETRVAARYATSIFNLAKERNILDQVMEDAQGFMNICHENHAFDLMLKSPITHTYKKWAVIKQIFSKDFNTITMAFMKIVLRKNRSFVMRLIFELYAEMYKENKGIVTASVYTAIPIGDTIKEQINTYLTGQTQKTIDLQMHVNPELLGGFIIRYDDKLLDASVSTQLKTLRHHLIHNN